MSRNKRYRDASGAARPATAALEDMQLDAEAFLLNTWVGMRPVAEAGQHQQRGARATPVRQHKMRSLVLADAPQVIDCPADQLGALHRAGVGHLVVERLDRFCPGQRSRRQPIGMLGFKLAHVLGIEPRQARPPSGNGQWLGHRGTVIDMFISNIADLTTRASVIVLGARTARRLRAEVCIGFGILTHQRRSNAVGIFQNWSRDAAKGRMFPVLDLEPVVAAAWPVDALAMLGDQALKSHRHAASNRRDMGDLASRSAKPKPLRKQCVRTRLRLQTARCLFQLQPHQTGSIW